MKYPDDMDKECVRLCNALNALDGVETFESCIGHGIDKFWILFCCSVTKSLSEIAHCQYVLNKTSNRIYRLEISCNDIGELRYVLVILSRRKAEEMANTLAYLLENL